MPAKVQGSVWREDQCESMLGRLPTVSLQLGNNLLSIGHFWSSLHWELAIHSFILILYLICTGDGRGKDTHSLSPVRELTF